MSNEEWIKTLADGRQVQFTYQELVVGAFITAQIAGNEVVYSVVLTKAKNPEGKPETLVKWFYPGNPTGHELVYSKQEEQQLAQAQQQTIKAQQTAQAGD